MPQPHGLTGSLISLGPTGCLGEIKREVQLCPRGALSGQEGHLDTDTDKAGDR